MALRGAAADRQLVGSLEAHMGPWHRLCIVGCIAWLWLWVWLSCFYLLNHCQDL